MTPLAPTQLRRLLREAVTLLDGADHEKDMLTWHARKDDFLTALAVILRVDGVKGIVAALKPSDESSNN